jgi:hypothetical protein
VSARLFDTSSLLTLLRQVLGPELGSGTRLDLTSLFRSVLSSVLMLNAAIGKGGGTFDNNLDAWRELMDINLSVVPILERDRIDVP